MEKNKMNKNINPERLTSMENPNDSVLAYKKRTLDIFARILIEDSKYDELNHYISETLHWSEEAKLLSGEEREMFLRRGVNLDVHNEGSVDIYKFYQMPDKKDFEIISRLILTHGYIGQFIRGEIPFSANEPLYEILENNLLTGDELRYVLTIINQCVIEAVSLDLWESIQREVYMIIDEICCGKRILDYTLRYKFAKLFGDEHVVKEEDEKLIEKIFKKHLWYPTIALSCFGYGDIISFFKLIENEIEDKKNVSFLRLAHNLNYDYEGKRKINVYKQRVIESYLRGLRNGNMDPVLSEHVKVKIDESAKDTVLIDFEFTKACDLLLQFCVESERSGLMSYQKNIATILDLFGFRRDAFDRLNNEEKYLATMNDVKNSTKMNILNNVVGKKIVDVGSGGGFMLDLLEERFPDADIIGTDISENVIEKLNEKIAEGHKFRVMKHNFVNGPLPEKVDTIIFSSILHEIYSYTELGVNKEKFNICSVELALENAMASLNPGGHIIIRDGILLNDDETYKVKFKKPDGEIFFKNYRHDFKGMKPKVAFPCKEEGVYYVNMNYLREFLFTYTWGNESYQAEVQEQFGYYTIDEFISELKKIGMTVLSASQYTEQGYVKYLKDLVEIETKDGEKFPVQAIISTAFIVAAK